MAGGNRSIDHSALIYVIRDYLRAIGAWELKTASQGLQRAGVPDILGCLSGRMVAIEAKTGRAQLSTRQQIELADLRKAGALCVVAHTLDDVEDVLVDAGLVEKKLYRRREA